MPVQGRIGGRIGVGALGSALHNKHCRGENRHAIFRAWQDASEWNVPGRYTTLRKNRARIGAYCNLPLASLKTIDCCASR